MANYHTDQWIMAQVERHYREALMRYPEHRIIGVFLQGSQNYGLDYEGSDIDTKCILAPSWEDLCFNRKAVSTTHVLDNEEHLDAKDIRLYMQCFRKQNLNFVEILFTPYKIINPMYADFWNKLVDNNELIARYDPVGAVKTMKGIAMEKFHALKHEYPSKVELIKKFGYDPKQLHHLLRVDEYLERYIDGEQYADCLISQMSDYLHDVKRIKDDKTLYTLEEAEGLANVTLAHVTGLADAYCGNLGKGEQVNPAVDVLLDSVQKDIMTKSIKFQLALEGE
jgi:predicted nucleotidyltransferase